MRKLCCVKMKERNNGDWINFLVMRERESQSTVNQLTVKIQELHDKVNSLSDSIEFFDFETANSSGLSHVTSQPVSIQSFHGMLSCDSCWQPDTGNSFENYLHRVNRQWRPSFVKFKKFCISTMRARVSEHRKTC